MTSITDTLQLPLVDLVAQLRVDYPTSYSIAIEEPPAFAPKGILKAWPHPAKRHEWAVERTILHGLSPTESAILKHVCHRAGATMQGGVVIGCIQPRARIALETGMSRRAVIRAMNCLSKLRLIATRKVGEAVATWPNSASLGAYSERYDKRDCLDCGLHQTTEKLLTIELIRSVLGECHTVTPGVPHSHP